MTCCEQTAVDQLMVDCGDVFDPLEAFREDRAQALLAALAPIGGVEFVVRYVCAPGPGDAPGRHWAVRLANEWNRPQLEAGEQGLLTVAGVPLTPEPPVLWWTTAEVMELKRRRLIRLAEPTRYRPGKRCYELGAPHPRKRKAKA